MKCYVFLIINEVNPRVNRMNLRHETVYCTILFFIMALICCFWAVLGDFKNMFCSQILKIAKIKTREIAIMTKFAKISSRKNIDFYSKLRL